jgi:DDE superfamily endonuclease
MPSLPEAIILVLAPLAPLLSNRMWGHAQILLLGAILAPGARTVTTALRAMGLAAERHFTNDHRVLNRATWSARQGSRMLLGVLVARLVSPGGRHSCGERMTRSNAVAAVRSPPKVVTEMRYARPTRLSSAVSG